MRVARDSSFPCPLPIHSSLPLAEVLIEWMMVPFHVALLRTAGQCLSANCFSWLPCVWFWSVVWSDAHEVCTRHVPSFHFFLGFISIGFVPRPI